MNDHEGPVAEQISHAALHALCGGACALRRQADGVVLPARLVGVSERKLQGGYEEFTVLFRVTGDAQPQQGICTVSFENRPAQDMFVVPVGREGVEILYEACFMRHWAGD